MRSWIAAGFVLLTTTLTPCHAQQVGWHDQYSEAKAAAARDGLPLLIHFGAWYCGPCQMMEREVFHDSEVLRTLGAGLAAVKIDVSQESEIAGQYGATTVPRDVVVYQDGTTETLNVGRMSKSSYLALLQNVAARGRKTAVPKPVEPSVKDPGNDLDPVIVKSDAANAVITTAPSTSIDPPLIGLEGYCPVRLHNNREWVAGKETITADYRGIRYFFQSETERELFLKSPSEYAPQDLGCDPVVLTKDLKAVVGSIRYGAFFDSRLYLFRSVENRESFKQNPLKYTRVRSALKADQIEGTRFE